MSRGFILQHNKRYANGIKAALKQFFGSDRGKAE